jgi:6-phosphogluconolactonase
MSQAEENTVNRPRDERVGGSKNRRRPLPVVVKRLGSQLVAVFVALSAVSALSAPALAGTDGGEVHGRPVGAVYVASNEFSGNKILTFLRFADGSLAPAGPGVPTGGLGTGPGLLLPDDPIGSQNSLIVDQENQRLFAVNAASNDVSVFAIHPDGLTLVDRQPSYGAFPVSLALDKDTLYVLNAVDNSVSGFDVGADGHLAHLQTCTLPDLPAGGDGIMPGTATQSPQPVVVQTAGQVGFSPDGAKLVVVSKEGPLLQGFPFGPTLGSGRIHVYDVDQHDGALENCGDPTTTALPSNSGGQGKFPFDFTWSENGQLLMVEIFGAATSPTGGAVSSFSLGNDGSLTPISVSVGNGQGATCWIVRSGKNVYAANFISDRISSYTVKSKGQLTLTNGAAATFGPGWTESPIDMAVTDDGRFIYQLTPGSAHIRPFKVNSSSGALTALTPVADGLAPHSGQAGIVTVDFA